MARSTRTTLSTRRLAVATLGTGLALVLSACGSGAAETSGPAAAASSGGSSAVHDGADVTFVDDMIPHHSSAVAMAQTAATRAGSPQVKALAEALARSIVTGQTAQIATMQQLLTTL